MYKNINTLRFKNFLQTAEILSTIQVRATDFKNTWMSKLFLHKTLIPVIICVYDYRIKLTILNNFYINNLRFYVHYHLY